MTKRFDITNYLRPDSTTPKNHWNQFDAPFTDLRFRIPIANEIVITAETESNLPLIAERELGDQSLWWTILHFNQLYDPVVDVFPGQRLKIPSRRELIAVLDAALDDLSASNPTVIL